MRRCGCRWVVILSLAVGVAAGDARADDTFSAVGAGGLVFQATEGVAMQREDLVLSPDEVRVRYEMRNDGASPVSGHVAFPLPPVYAGDNHYQAQNLIPDAATAPYLRFTLVVDGQPKQTAMRVWATLNEADVTAVLAQNGLDVRTIKLRPQIEAADLPEGAVARLQAAGLLDEQGGDLVGQWQTHVTFEWEQSYAPGVTIVEHRYVPFLGGAYDPGNVSPILEPYGTQYCMADTARAAAFGHLLQSRQADPDAMVWMSFLSFILRTAKNWHGPIGAINVTLQAAHPEDAVAICPGGLQFHPDGLGRLVATAHDWVADSDLDAMFVSLHPIKQAIP